MSANPLRSDPIRIQVGETLALVVNFAAWMQSGEELTGTPTLELDEKITGEDFTVNDEALTVDGQTVAVGKGVSFSAACAAEAVSKVLRLSVETDGGQALIAQLDFRVYE